MYHSVKIIILILLLASFAGENVNAQKFGDIDLDKLKEEVHPRDAEASHAFLHKNCFIHYELKSRIPKMVSEYHNRIKIYKDEGVDEANIVRYLYREDRDRESILGVKAQCYNLVNGKMEVTKLSKSDIYEEKINENITKISFAIPNVRAGSIIEFKYRINSPFLYSFPRHYFQENVPVDNSELTLDIPVFFTMAPSSTGVIALEQTVDPSKRSYGHDVSQYKYRATDVPAIDEDKYVLDIDDYRSSIKYELSQIAYPGRKVVNFTKDWNSICKNLKTSKLFGKALKANVKPAKTFLDEIEPLDDKEKLYRIVEFINSNLVWNGKMGKYGTTDYDALFESKEGSVGELNLLLINLCRKAGLEAQPVLSKYRFDGILNTNYPSLTEINYVFGYVKVADAWLMVDATSPYTEPGKLPLRALNIEGVLMTEDMSKIIAIDNTNLYYKRLAGKFKINLEEGRLEGSGKTELNGYAAAQARRKAQEVQSEEADQQALLKGSQEEDEEDKDTEEESEEEADDEIMEDVYVYSDASGLEQKYGKITSPFEAHLYDAVEQIDDKIFLDALVTLEFDENPFLNEKRNYPAFFNAKHAINYISMIDIPEGYKLESAPENISIKIINDKGSFLYSTKVTNNILVVNANFKIDHDIFFPDEYDSLYAFFNMILSKQNEKIVLAKL